MDDRLLSLVVGWFVFVLLLCTLALLVAIAVGAQLDVPPCELC